jgi:hypothetical protein
VKINILVNLLDVLKVLKRGVTLLIASQKL